MFYISSCVLYFQWFIKNREIWNHLMEKNFSNGKKKKKKKNSIQLIHEKD